MASGNASSLQSLLRHDKTTFHACRLQRAAAEGRVGGYGGWKPGAIRLQIACAKRSAGRDKHRTPIRNNKVKDGKRRERTEALAHLEAVVYKQ